MKAVLVAVALLAGVALASADDKVEWQKYTPKDAKCAIHFPGKPREKEAKDGVQALLETRNGKAVYFLQTTTFSKTIKLDAPVVKKIFDNTRAALEKSLKGTIVAEKDVKLGNYPGRYFEVDAPALGIYRTHLYVSTTMLFQVVVAGPQDFVDSEDAQQFVGSFKLTD
jgi:hypothetical protein